MRGARTGNVAKATPSASGLSEAVAARRLARVGANELPPPPREGRARRWLRQLREPMALLLVAAAVVSGIGLGEPVDAAAILAIVVLNAAIGAVQEGKAEHALEALREMQTPTARVRRDGVVRTIPATDLAPGDVVLLAAGGRVPADLELLDATGLELDESVLTGESLPVPKRPGRGEAGLLFSGTHVTRGTAEALVLETGPRTRLGGIAERLTVPRRYTPLQRELARLSLRLGTIAVAIAIGFGVVVLVRAGPGGGGLEEAFLAGVALAVAAVPEGLATVVAVGLALGVRRMAAEGAIVRRLPAVETLGSTSVILTDKTGTLTENRMRLDDVLVASTRATGLDRVPGPARERIARAAAICNDAEIRPPSGDPIEVALLAAVGADRVAHLRAAHPRRALRPFDAERRRMATLHDHPEGPLLVVKGAPEEVVGRATRALTPGDGVSVLDDRLRARLLAEADRLATAGARLLALAERQPAAGLEERGLTLLALLALRDPIRPEASDAVAEARRAGIRVLMVTGDHAGTAAHIAGRVGIGEGADRPMTGPILRTAGVPEEPLEHAVYARVDPEQKLALVERLQDRGEVVAVTGDGVNDAPALRRADIGVAMGRSGSDVAREAADMVVTDDNLATIVTAVREGRGVYENIRKVVDYLVGGNLSEIAVVVGALLLFPALGVPLFPLQLLWINLLTDGLPAVGLGVDRVDPGVMRRPPRRQGDGMLPPRRVVMLGARGLLIAGSALASLAVVRFAWNGDWVRARTVMFSALVLAHLLYALVVRYRRGAAHPGGALIAAIAFGLLLQVGAVAWPDARSILDTAPLSPRDWALVATAGTLPIGLMWAAAPRTRKRRSP